MDEDQSKFTHVAIEKQAKRKIALLSKALDVDIYSLVGYWADTEWDDALKKGLVTKAMLESGKSNKAVAS